MFVRIPIQNEIKWIIFVSAEEIIESEEEEDSAVAFKKAGSEASEPDVSKFKVFYKTDLQAPEID